MCPGERTLGGITLKVILLISFPFVCHSQSDYSIIDDSTTVKALLGQSVTIPCVLTHKNQPILDLDLITDSVRWVMKSLNGSEHNVYLLTLGNHTAHRPNSSVDLKEFKRGDTSITLYDVKRSDEGEYVCIIFVAGDKVTAARTLEVSARPVVALSSHHVTVEVGTEKSIACEVGKFYPESVDIRWVKHTASGESDLDKQTCTSVPTKADDGTFNVTSMMSVKPSSTSESGEVYSCIVRHRSLQMEHSENCTVTVEESPSNTEVVIGSISGSVALVFLIIGIYLYLKKSPPEVSEITGLKDLSHGKRTTLSCMVSGFKPRDIEAIFYLKRIADVKEQEICCYKYPKVISEPQHKDNVDHPNGQPGEQVPLTGVVTEDRPSFIPNIVQDLKPSRSFLSYNYLCSFEMTPDIENDEGAVLSVEVKHSALKQALVKHKTLEIDGDFLRLSRIKAPQNLKHNAEVTLTCTITTKKTFKLYITWLKKEQKTKKTLIIYEGEDSQERYHYHEENPETGSVRTLSSSVTFTALVKEDCDTKYICRVRYPQINQTAESFLETSIIAEPVLDPITPNQGELSANQPMELRCRIHSFYPRFIYLRWYKGDEVISKVEPQVDAGEDGLGSCTSILKITPSAEDIGQVFRCSVDHQSITDPKTSQWILRELKTNGITKC